jgi:hypothetical protein
MGRASAALQTDKRASHSFEPRRQKKFSPFFKAVAIWSGTGVPFCGELCLIY